VQRPDLDVGGPDDADQLAGAVHHHREVTNSASVPLAPVYDRHIRAAADSSAGASVMAWTITANPAGRGMN
jgi:hypothetical protein